MTVTYVIIKLIIEDTTTQPEVNFLVIFVGVDVNKIAQFGQDFPWEAVLRIEKGVTA